MLRLDQRFAFQGQLWGERDEWIPIERGEPLAQVLSDRSLLRIENAGHLVQEDVPEAIVAAMLEQRWTARG
jgi:pimeloyl-ACP methyl ester carboxylesterase